MMIQSLQERWKSAGLQQGDILLLHSNIKRTLIEYRKSGLAITPQDILDSFLDVLGPAGTLLLPLFNFDFSQGTPFDIRTTESRMGALTEAGRTHPDAVRTGHPLYSFAVIGHQAHEFEGVDNESGYAEDSPFGLLRRLDGKIGILDLDDQNSMTFYHHVEEIKRVDYRYFKAFTGDYTDQHGQTTRKTYTLYVRDIERGVKTMVNPAGELLWEAGLYQGFRPKVEAGLRLIKARDLFQFVAEDLIDQGKALGTLYAIGD